MKFISMLAGDRYVIDAEVAGAYAWTSAKSKQVTVRSCFGLNRRRRYARAMS